MALANTTAQPTFSKDKHLQLNDKFMTTKAGKELIKAPDIHLQWMGRSTSSIIIILRFLICDIYWKLFKALLESSLALHSLFTPFTFYSSIRGRPDNTQLQQDKIL